MRDDEMTSRDEIAIAIHKYVQASKEPEGIF